MFSHPTRPVPLRVATLFAALLGCPSATPEPEPDPPTPEPPADLTAVLTLLWEDGALPGLAAGVTSGERLLAVGAVGQRVWEGSAPVTPTDPWHLGSNTKAMTATLAATFVEAGELDWDAPLPSLFPGQDVDLGWSAVTFADLLSHHAGVDDDAVLVPVLNSLRASLEPPRAQRASFAADVLADPPSAPTGAFLYSNAGYMVAGAVLEALADEPWEQLMAERLFTPLGMGGCAFGAPGTDAQPADAPWGHAANGAGWVPIPPGPLADNPAALGPAGTVHCPLAAWAAFARSHLGGDLVSAEALGRMHRDEGDGYGLGWGIVLNTPAGLALQHSGSNTVWNTDLWVFPEVDRAYFSATNAYGPGTFNTLDAAIVALIDEWPWE